MRFLLLSLLLCAAGMPVPSAEAASSASPFAGSYQGYMPLGGALCAITISAEGRISGVGGSPIIFQQVVTGSVSDGGRMSCAVTTYVPRRGGRGANSQTTKFKAYVELDPAGNIVGTTDKGASFTWYRV